MLFSRREHLSLQGLLETRVEITITMTMGNNILRTTKVIPCLLIADHTIATEMLQSSCGPTRTTEMIHLQNTSSVSTPKMTI